MLNPVMVLVLAPS